MVQPKRSRKPKRKLSEVSEGVAHIKAGFNNTTVSITTEGGDLLASRSAGTCGFKGSRKGTPYPASLAGKEVGDYVVQNHKMKRVKVQIKGAGQGRDQAIRALHTAGLKIESLSDVTPLPHNGCRPRKKQRK